MTRVAKDLLFSLSCSDQMAVSLALHLGRCIENAVDWNSRQLIYVRNIRALCFIFFVNVMLNGLCSLSETNHMHKHHSS